MAPKKRATTEKDKQKKRERLLKAAWRLYEKGGGQLPTVTRIAQQARVSKGTVYLYFRTKEEIFLQLYMDRIRENFDQIKDGLGRVRGRISATRLAKIATAGVMENPLQLKMGSQVRSVLEENTGDARLLETKLEIGRMVEEMGRAMAGRIRGLSERRAVKLMVQVNALVTGLWQMTNTTPEVRKQLKAAGATMFDIDFSKDAVDAVTALIRGTLPKGA